MRALADPPAINARLMALVLEEVDGGIAVVDGAWRVVYGNAAARGIFAAFPRRDALAPDALCDLLARASVGAQLEAIGTMESRDGARFFVRAKRLPGDGRFLVLLRPFVVRDRDLSEALRERYALSVRDQQIVLGVRAGMTNAQIAERAGLSEGTVKQYLSRIFTALGVSSRTQLVAALRTLGEDELPAPSGRRPTRIG